MIFPVEHFICGFVWYDPSATLFPVSLSMKEPSGTAIIGVDLKNGDFTFAMNPPCSSLITTSCAT